MNSHPHGEQLSAYLDGMLEVAQMRNIAVHLGICASCRTSYQGLQQTKSLLRVALPPASPAPEFWASAYRRMRVEDAATRPAFPQWSWQGLREAMQEPQRRWSAGLAAATLIAAALVGPLVTLHTPVTLPNTTTLVSSAFPTSDSVDVSSLVQAHTESAARQPLADADRQNMIAMDDSFTADDNGAEMAAYAPDSASDAAP